MYKFNEDEKFQFNENRFIIIDNFLDKALIYQNEIVNSSAEKWDRYDNMFERKNTYRDKHNFPPNINNLFSDLTSEIFINKLNDLTGLELINDNERMFWGIHTFTNDDKLDIHVDAGKHLPSGMHKAITLGIYLSKDWIDENYGNFEFWNGDNVNSVNPKIYYCHKKVLPIFNRCIIFENNNNSWHGAPEPCKCKNGEIRIFMTLSYLIKEPTQTINNLYYKAFFIKRPQDEENPDKDKQRLLRVNHLTCHSVYNTKKDMV
jgi:Rps23 Pro-64 3,4-dihydroxylase Tpa1-like proline 4-hydroxylase